TLGSENSVPKGTDFVFFLTNTTQLKETERHFSLTAEEIELLNPNTRTCPIFRSKKDAEITKLIYQKIPILIDENMGDEGNPFGIKFCAMFHMANDSHLFKTYRQLNEDGWSINENIFHNFNEKQMPLYEAKMIWHYDHRFGSYEGVNARSNTHLPDHTLEQYNDPNRFVQPWYWVTSFEVEKCLSLWNKGWLFGFRSITNVTNERTMILTVFPRTAVSGKLPLMLPLKISTYYSSCLEANLNSLVFDYFTRQKIGGTDMAFHFVKQLPVLPTFLYDEFYFLCDYSIGDWINKRVLELTYNSWDLEPFAKDCGYNGPPFKWDEERRFLLRCELDAAYFHLYLGTPEEWQEQGTQELLDYFPTPRDAVDYIMETFPIVKRKDIQKYEEYRTKRVILEIYDEMAEAMRTGTPYQTRLDPPPADPRVAHEGRK
ncbi:MAG: hypothetical protein ACTSXM_00920, partial [Promethearchaeota archaeon]